jgi:chorismate mutase
MSKQKAISSLKSLKAGRQRIDWLDAELLRLLNRRARIAIKLGAIKIACGLPAYDGRRERQVLARMQSRNQGPFAGESVARIFGCIIRETRKIGTQSMRQQRIKSRSSSARRLERLPQENRNGHQHGSRRV